MPAVSLPPKENALFKRILVSGRLRASGGRDAAGTRACQPLASVRRAPRRRRGPRLETARSAPRGPPCGPRAGAAGSPRPAPRSRGRGRGRGPVRLASGEARPGAGGAAAAPLIHCPGAAFPPSPAPPSSSRVGIHLCPRPGSRRDRTEGGTERRTEFRRSKGSFPAAGRLAVRCIAESGVARPRLFFPPLLFSRVREGTRIS